MKVLFATVMILALAGCTTPHYKGGKRHNIHSAIPCCQQETCKCAVTKTGKAWGHDRNANWETRRKRLGEAVRKGDMTPEEARKKAGDMRRNSNRSGRPRR